MANQEQLEILKQGVEVWNQWREEHPDEKIELRGVDLTGALLQGADLHEANLSRTNLIGARLFGANLRNANLLGANLVQAELNNADITGAYLYGTARDDWSIENITCDYVFWDDKPFFLGKEQEERWQIEHRFPKDRNLRPGEFEELYKQLFGENLAVLLSNKLMRNTETVRIEQTDTISEPVQDIKVFICYAREDLNMAQRIYYDLQRTGIEAWLDIENLKPGQKWELIIQQAMKNSSYVLILLSRCSVSKRGFIQNEIKHAFKLADSFPTSAIFIIPARLEDCEPPDELHGIQWVDLFPDYDDGFAKLLPVFAPEGRDELLLRKIQMLTEEYNHLKQRKAQEAEKQVRDAYEQRILALEKQKEQLMDVIKMLGSGRVMLQPMQSGILVKPTLSAALTQQIVEFLSSLPELDKEDARRAWLFSAGLDTPLQQQIQIGGSSRQFFQLLAQTTVAYGRLHDGRFALEAILTAAKSLVGPDRQAHADSLMAQIQTEMENWQK